METLLLALIFISIVVILLTPYFESGIIMAIISLAGYYHVANINSWTPIVLLTGGLILIFLEILVPAFGLIGLLGFASITIGLYYTTGDVGKTITDLIIALALASISIIVLFKRGYNLSNWSRFVLNTQIQSDEKSERIQEDTNLRAGMVGEASTSLRPSGKALFENSNTLFDVLSDDGHISKGTKIIIQKIIGKKIVVRKK